MSHAVTTLLHTALVPSKKYVYTGLYFDANIAL